jgi:methylase of polypeptide subunit release factors
LQGDLYDPVRGLTFDRIVAHPPCVPAAEQELLYRDGGEDGDQVLRLIVAGLPRHLRAGGIFYAFTILAGGEGETIEARIRTWLGGVDSEFEVKLEITGEAGIEPCQAAAERLKITKRCFAALSIARSSGAAVV